MADDDEAPGDVGTTTMPVLSAEGWAVYPSVMERYFTTYTTSNHQALHVHSNGLCLLSLAPSHPLLVGGGPRITSVCFRDHDTKDLMSNEVRGKKKAGAIFMGPRDMVATVHTEDGAEPVTLYACVRANVIEVNKELVKSPELLRATGSRGWLAVLMPKMGEKQGIGAALLELERAQAMQQQSGSLKRPLDDNQPAAPEKKKRKAGKVCWDFTERGRCKFGVKCRFSHGEPAASGEGGESAVGGESAAPAVSGEGDTSAVVGESAEPAVGGNGAETAVGGGSNEPAVGGESGESAREGMDAELSAGRQSAEPTRGEHSSASGEVHPEDSGEVGVAGVAVVSPAPVGLSA
jgi:hypothetical protein